MTPAAIPRALAGGFPPHEKLLCGLALLAFVASCSKPKTDALQIAVIPKGTTHEFWKSIHAGAKKAEP